MRRSVLLAPALLLITGCDRTPTSGPTGPATVAPTAPATSPAAAGPAAPVGTVPPIAGLVFGQPLAAASGWRADRDQISDECQTYASPAYPGAYAMAIEGKLQRVTFSAGSGFRLPSGIAPGAAEAAVRKAYPDVVAEPHKYAEAPAKYLTQPHLDPGEVGLRFEIGGDGKVQLIHIGLPSALPLVEGCA